MSKYQCLLGQGRCYIVGPLSQNAPLRWLYISRRLDSAEPVARTLCSSHPVVMQDGVQFGTSSNDCMVIGQNIIHLSTYFRISLCNEVIFYIGLKTCRTISLLLKHYLFENIHCMRYTCQGVLISGYTALYIQPLTFRILLMFGAVHITFRIKPLFILTFCLYRALYSSLNSTFC